MIGPILAFVPIETLLNVLGFILALVAIAFTIYESWSNHCVRISIEEISNSGSVSVESRGKMIQELKLRIKNHGIPLYAPSVAISFREPDGFGSMATPMKPRTERTGKVDEFARGMIAEFSIKSSECASHEREFMGALRDCRRQEAYLNVYSQGYLVKRWRIGGLWDRIAGPWNSFAFRFNMRFERKIKTASGREGVHIPKRLPTFTTLEWPIGRYMREIQNQSDVTFPHFADGFPKPPEADKPT